MSSSKLQTIKMAFDNSDFEQRISATLKSLSTLKKSMEFSDAGKGLENLKENVGNFKFDALLDGVNAISDRFSVLGEVAHNTLMGMVNTAIDAGKSIANALVIEPITDGYKEYETQINSVQTIMANVEDEGKGLNEVNTALDELNTYADKTIYNFTEMTRNIGTFTAAGVDLDTSVSAIQGIANAAAVSGANSEQAARGMYQISQALASGKVGLQDWNSMLTANLAGETVQKAIMDTARAHGIAIDEMKESAGSFRAMLNSKDYGDWLTADILLESFEKFTAGSEGITEEQLKQMQELYRARGYTEDQIKSLTESQRVLTQTELDEIKAKWKAKGYSDEEVESILALGRSATEAATKVKTFSQLIDTLKEGLGSGWTQSWEYIIGDFEQAKELWSEIYDVLSIYINASADARNATLKDWSENGGRVAIINALRNAFQGLLGVILPLSDSIKAVFPPITAQQLITYSKKIEELSSHLKVTDEQADQIRYTAIKVFTVIRNGLEGIVNIGKTVFSIFLTIGKGIKAAIKKDDIDKVLTLSERFKDLTNKLIPTTTTLGNLQKLVTGVTSVFRALGNILISVANILLGSFGKAFDTLVPKSESFMDVIGNFGDWLTKFAELLESSINYEAMAGGFNSIAEAAGKLAEGLFKLLKLDKAIEFLKNFFDVSKGAKDAANSFNILDAVFGKLKELGDWLSQQIGRIDWTKIDIIQLLKFIAGGELFRLVHGILDKFKKTLKDTSEAPTSFLDKITDGLDKLAEGLNNNVSTITKCITDIGTSLQTAINVDIFKKVAISFVLLAASLAVIANIEPDKLAMAMGAITGLIVETCALINYLGSEKIKNPKEIGDISKGIIIIAAAILIMSISLKKLGDMDAEALGRGITGVSVLIAELTHTAKTLSKEKIDPSKITESSKGLIIFAASIRVLVMSVKALGNLDPDTMNQGVRGVATLLVELLAAAKVLSGQKIDGSKIEESSKGLVIFAAAVRVLVMSVKALGKIDPNTMTASVIAVGALVVAMVAAAWVLSKNQIKPNKINNASKGLLIFAATVRVLVLSVTELAKYNFDQMVTALIGVAGLTVALVAAAYVLSRSEIKPNKIRRASVGLAVFALVLKGLSTIIVDLSKISRSGMQQALAGFVVILIALLGTMALMSTDYMKPDKISSFGWGLMVFGDTVKKMGETIKMVAELDRDKAEYGFAGLVMIFAMLLLSFSLISSDFIKPDKINQFGFGLYAFGDVCKKLAEVIATVASLDQDKALIGMLGLMVIMAAIIIACAAMSSDEVDPVKMLAVSSTLIVFGVAVTLMAAALKILGSIPVVGIIAGIVAIIALFAIMGIAAVVLQPLIPQIIALSGALLMFAAAAALFGIGIGVAAAGLAMLVTAVTVGGAAILGFIAGMIAMLPGWGIAVGMFIRNLVVTLLEGLPQLMAIGREMFAEFLKFIKENGPLLIETFTTLGLSLLEQIGTLGPRLVAIGLEIIDIFLKALADHMPSIVDSGCKILLSLIEGITVKMPELVDAAFKMIIGFIDGLAKAIDENHDALWDAIGHLIISIGKAILDGLGKIKDAAGELLHGFLEGFDPGKIWEDLKQVGSNLLKGIIDGIGDFAKGVWDSASGVAKTALDAISSIWQEHSPSKAGRRLAVFLDKGLIQGFEAEKNKVANSAGGVAYAAISALSDGLDEANGINGLSENYTPSITPVIDASEIQNGINSIDGMVNTIPDSYNITGNILANNKMKHDLAKIIAEPNDYSSILRSMGELRNDLNSFSETMSKMNIIMDTGTLVGALTPGMDRSLGFNSILAGRGVI